MCVHSFINPSIFLPQNPSDNQPIGKYDQKLITPENKPHTTPSDYKNIRPRIMTGKLLTLDFFKEIEDACTPAKSSASFMLS